MNRAGFDIGGSHIAAGLYDEKHALLARVTKPFPKGRPDDVPALIASMAAELGARAGETESIGLAVPGSLDREAEYVLHAFNLDFHNFPLRSRVQALVGNIPVIVGNDADTAALGELYAGAFRNAQTAVLLTLGTGLGGGVIINGKLWHGGMGNGVEIGHAILDMTGEAICTCGVRGCYEARCSATAIIRDARAAIEKHPASMLASRVNAEGATLDARLVFECAYDGDAAAKEVFDLYAESVGSAVASIINILDPEVIALGGGVSLAGEKLLAPVRAVAGKKSFFETHGRIVQAELGNDAGMLGASMLYTDSRK